MIRLDWVREDAFKSCHDGTVAQDGPRCFLLKARGRLIEWILRGIWYEKATGNRRGCAGVREAY